MGLLSLAHIIKPSLRLFCSIQEMVVYSVTVEVGLLMGCLLYTVFTLELLLTMSHGERGRRN